MTPQPTYILAPSFHFKPETGPIALGNIISHPLRPHRALTTVDRTTLSKIYPRIETFTDYDRSITRGSSRSVSVSLWSQFLETVTGKIGGGHDDSVTSNYTMGSLETEYFAMDPSMEEIKMRLKSPRVQAVTKESRMPGFRTPVYMVTGRMIAKGFSTELSVSNVRHKDLEMSGEAPSPIGQVGAGVSLARSSSTEQADKWRAGDDIVFAYQLHRIDVKGWKGDGINYDELRHKAAFLSKDDEDDTEEEVEVEEDIIFGPAGADAFLEDQKIGQVVIAETESSDVKINCIFSKDI